MENHKVINSFKTHISELPGGRLVRLELAQGLSFKDSIVSERGLLLAYTAYHKRSTNQLIYSLIDEQGSTTSFVEAEGILPTLFLAPDATSYVSLIPYHPDKELEVSIPIFDREGHKLPKGNRPFLGDFIGTLGANSLFFECDPWSSGKPDKLLYMAFKDGQLKKKKQVKIPLPRKNKRYVDALGLHLFGRAEEEGTWLHRLLDAEGQVVRQRELHSDRAFYREVVELSFDAVSYLLAEEEGGSLLLECVQPDGRIERKLLYSFGDFLYNTWPPVKVAEDTYVIRFNDGFGNGWLTINKGELLELFYNKDVAKGYRNLLTDELLDLGQGQLILADIQPCSEGYAAIFYPSTSEDQQPKELLIFFHKTRFGSLPSD